MPYSADFRQANSDAKYFTTKFHITFSMASDAMLIVERESLKVKNSNFSAQRLFGYTDEEFQNIDYSKLCADQMGCKLLIKKQYSYHSSIKHIKKNGNTFLAAVCFGYFRHERKKLVLVSLKDISINKDCLERIHKQERMIHEDKMLNNTKAREAYLIGEESERLRLSRELHDHIGQLLISSKISVERCLLMCKDKKMNALLDESVNQLAALINEVRETSHNVVSGFVKPQSLPVSIRNLAAKFNEMIEVELEMNEDEFPNHIASFAHINIYRILEESLSNIAKHSEATTVRIKAGIKDLLLLIEIVDNGKGIQTHPPRNTYGLSVMQHRAKLLGGEIKFESIFGKFFKSLLFVPMEKWISENNSLIMEA